jgi:hypothetical protein
MWAGEDVPSLVRDSTLVAGDGAARQGNGSRGDVARFGFGDRGSGGARKGIRQSGNDAIELVVAYVKQEMLDPLAGLGRYLVFGVVGSIAITVGSVILLVAVLRILQTETAAFHGNLSWVPYVIVLAIAVAIIAVTLWRVASGPARRRQPKVPTSKGG